MGSRSKSSGGGGGNRGKVLQQDYSSFKTPEATKAALNRQKNILDRNRTSTGAFANQADALRQNQEFINKGYTLNDTRDKVMSPTGATIAGINKNNNLFSGSREVSDILKRNLNTNPNQRDSFSPESTRQDDRVANTFNVLDQIYDLDELSKAGEEKVNRVFDYGRGVKFANDPNPADPFRFTASTPTGPQLRFPLSESNMGEAFGDMKRALSGGTAEQTIPNLSVANQPRYQEGILNAYKRIPTPTNLLMKMFGGEEEEQLNALQTQRQGYANDPYSVPTGRVLPLDYLQGDYNRLDPSDEDISVIENLDSIVEQISNSTRPTNAATGYTYPSNTRPTYAATGDTLNFKSPLEDTSYVDKILRDLTLENSSRPTNPATGDTLNFNSVFQRPTGPATGYTLDDRPTGPATGYTLNDRPTGPATGYTLDDRPTGPATGYTYPSNTRPTNPATGYTLNTRPTNAATGDISSIPSMPIFSGQMFKGEDEPYKTSTQKIADMLGVGNNISSENSESSEGEAFDPDDPFANLTDPDDLRRLDYFRNAGFPDDYILDYFQKMNYLAYGGSVAPQSGPMSNGIGTLYNTR